LNRSVEVLVIKFNFNNLCYLAGEIDYYHKMSINGQKAVLLCGTRHILTHNDKRVHFI